MTTPAPMTRRDPALSGWCLTGKHQEPNRPNPCRWSSCACECHPGNAKPEPPEEVSS